MATPGQAPSPSLIFETFSAYQRTAALKAAIELELFTAIGEGKQTVPELAHRCGTSERGMRILCDYLTVGGFLVKASQRYSLTPDSAVFLDRRSPGYLGGATEFLLSPPIMESFNDVAAIVRKGGTVLPDDGAIAPAGHRVRPAKISSRRNFEVSQIRERRHVALARRVVSPRNDRLGLNHARQNEPHESQDCQGPEHAH